MCDTQAGRRESDAKSCPLTQLALDHQMGAVALSNVFHNRQAQTGATGFARTTAINTVKPFG